MFVTDLYSQPVPAAQAVKKLRFSDQLSDPKDDRLLGSITFNTDS